MGTTRRLVAALLSLGVFAAGPASAEDEAAPKRLTFSGSLGVNAYALRGAAFGAPDQPKPGANYGWLESVGRVGLAYAFSDQVSVSAGVAGVFTLDADPFGVSDDGTALVESATLAITDLFTPGLDLSVGRQEMKIGDGFLVQDGYYDDKGAVWSIPLTFWDAARVDYRRGDFSGTAFGASLSSSFGYDGQLWGLDFAWTPGRKMADAGNGAEPGAEAGAADEPPTTYLALSGFARQDSGAADDDARLLSLRGSVPVGPVTLAGEYAFQGGRRQGVSVGGEAWHADARWDLPLGLSPYLFASYLHYSGDDPASASDENFIWRNYSSEDWSHYYLGEIVASSLLVNTDLNVLKLEGGFEIGEQLSLRLFYLDLKSDTGAYWEVPEDAGDSLGREFDAVLTWAPNEATELWVLYGQARPGSAGEALWGTRTSHFYSAGFAWSF